MANLLGCVKRTGSSTPPGPGRERNRRGFSTKALPPTPEWFSPSPHLQPRPPPAGAPPGTAKEPEGKKKPDVAHIHPQPDLPTEVSTSSLPPYAPEETSLCLDDSQFFSDPSAWLTSSLSANLLQATDSSAAGLGRLSSGGPGNDTGAGQGGCKPKVARRLFSDDSPQLPALVRDDGQKSSRDVTPPSPDFLTSLETTGLNIESSTSISTSLSENKTRVSPSRNTSRASKHRSTVDVNFANVHQLCVVGLTMTQAAAVVHHRVSQRRHYQSKEELKQVSGVDEETWSRVWDRITLVPAGLGMTGQSRSDCEEGQGESEDVSADKNIGRSAVDINLCNYHQLCIVGLSKSQALAVVEYRFKKGYFTSTKQVEMVPGISEEDFLRVQSRLTLAPGQMPPQRSKRSSSSKKKRTINVSATSYLSPQHVKSPPPAMVDSSVLLTPPPTPVKKETSSSFSPRSGDANLTLHLHPVVSNTPTGKAARVSPRGSGSKAGKEIVRIASWNLQCFNEKKTDNEGVLEVVCSVILQHGFDVIALQEIGSKSALEKVCQELNHPTLPKVQSSGSKQRQWECCVSSKPIGRMFQGMEYNGFLWNKCSGVRLESAGLMESEGTHRDDRLFVRMPFVGKFAVRDWDFVIASVHLRAENWGGKYKSEVENEVQNLSLTVESIGPEVGDSDIVLLGDFNVHPKSNCFQGLTERGYTHIFNEPTNISACNLEGSMCYDNIWVTPGLIAGRHSGSRGVVRRGLQHPLIPGRQVGERGGTVSDHCPVWVGFEV